MFYEMFFQTFADQNPDTSHGRKRSARDGRKFILTLLKNCHSQEDIELLNRRKALQLLCTFSSDFKNDILQIFDSYFDTIGKFGVNWQVLGVIIASISSRCWLDEKMISKIRHMVSNDQSHEYESDKVKLMSVLTISERALMSRKRKLDQLE